MTTLALSISGSIARRLGPGDEVVVTTLDCAQAALAVVDAVHAAQHRSIDVSAIGADVLFCSPYKVFGPQWG
jgi:selenocysteine lyase/cysteine desulfurase